MVVSFVDSANPVIPHKTLTSSQKESVDYNWYLISEGNHLCQHGDNSYVIMVDGDKIGCSCPAMSFHCKGNDVCKHIAAFVGMVTPSNKPIPGDIVLELLKAGWVGDPGSLKPPDEDSQQAYDDMITAEQDVDVDTVKATSDEGGEDNGGSDPTPPDTDKKPVPPEPKLGEKVFEKICPHCGAVERMTDTKKVSAWLKEHVAACKKNPANAAGSKTDGKAQSKEKPKMDEQVQRVIAEAEGLGATDIDAAYVQDQLDKLQNRFKVIRSEAERSVVSSILRNQSIKRPKGKGESNTLLTVGLIDAPDRWINMRIRVVDIWNSDSDSINQVGLVGDESGTIKFVSWKKSDLKPIEKDKCYSIENVVTDEYEGRFSVKFTKNTKIAEIDDDIEVEYATAEFTGILVDIQGGSGLIKRCPACNRALAAGVCVDHGAVDGVYDLRIKGVLDDGIKTVRALFNADRTTQLTGIDLDAAIALATDALDMNVVGEQMSDALISKEFVVTGSDMGDTILVESVKEITGTVSKEDIKALLAEV
jgi:replication factor A1